MLTFFRRRASQAGARASHSKHRHHKQSLQYQLRALVAPPMPVAISAGGYASS